MEPKAKALDVLLYVGIFITLIISVKNFIDIIFAAINSKFQDLLDMSYRYDMYNDGVRFAIASLVVIYPIYVALSWYTSRDIGNFLYKRDLKVRKVMIYAALFVTLCTLVGTLISVIYTFLGGELSARFGLKALTVFVVALAIFGYYVYNLRRDYSKKTKTPLIIGVVATAIIAASVVWSITIVGTPKEIRAKRIDSTRLSDLSGIQMQVVQYLQGADKLPDSLTELNNALQGYAVPVDPVTKEVYGYKVLEQPIMKMNYATGRQEMAKRAVFEICATFDTTRELDARGMQQDFGMGGGMSEKMYSVANYYSEYDPSPYWNHKAEYTCFKRIVTPDMYYGR